MKTIAVILIVFGCVAQATAECCTHCGCDSGCRNICHLKCDVKKVTKIEYSCECEDFCVPCRSKKVGYDCGDSCKGWSCAQPIYEPTGAVVHTRKKLVKHEVTTEVPAYRWVVETICPDCESRCTTCAGGKTKAQVVAETVARDAAYGRPAGPPLPAEPALSPPETNEPMPDSLPLRDWWSALGRKRAQR